MPAKSAAKKKPNAALAMQTETDYQHCASRLKAIADPDRLRIVNLLLRGDKSVSALADEMRVPIDKVSYHLGILREARLVQTKKQGKFIIYSLPPEVAACSMGGGAKTTGNGGVKTIDLGCCQLDLVQPTLPGKKSTRSK